MLLVLTGVTGLTRYLSPPPLLSVLKSVSVTELKGLSSPPKSRLIREPSP